MCGIAATISKTNNFEKNKIISNYLSHRGPDDSGNKTYNTSNNCFLGLVHRRLSIIDLSEGGKQPMVDEKKKNKIVFNGEIYNYKEIKQLLINDGIDFNSNSDTEVLLKALGHYEFKYILGKLRGMFAFAFWDNEKNKLLIARDPVGIKPLYYTHNGDEFACSSEIRALLKSGYSSSQLSKLGLSSYLSFGSINPPQTIFKEINTLLPGHYLEISDNGNFQEQECYWDWNNNKNFSDSSVIDILNTAIDRTLVSDVTIGTFLSGGYDSTAIATIISNKEKNSLNTFTISMKDDVDKNEADSALKIAKYLGSNHHQFEISNKNINDEINSYFHAMDHPSDDGLNTFLISKFVRSENIKVGLHGVGGDELFGGYPSFLQIPKIMRINKYMPKAVLKFLSYMFYGQSTIRWKVSKSLNKENNIFEIYFLRRMLLSSEEVNYINKDNIPNYYENTNHIKDWIIKSLGSVSDYLQLISFLELYFYASGKLLRDGDIMSMSHGLEIRFPLLDVDLIKKINSIEFKERKQNFAQTGKNLLTDEIENFPHHLMSQKKQGFTIPLKEWMKSEGTIELDNSNEKLCDILNFNQSNLKMIHQSNLTKNQGNEWLRSWQLLSLSKYLDINT